MKEKILSYLLPALLLFSSVAVFFKETSGSKSVAQLAGKDKVGLIKIYGIISVEPPRGASFVGLRGSDKWVQQLKFMRKERVKAVVLRINSPGGTIGACQEVVEEIEKIKKDGIPVVASLGDVAASGGYYIASACDKIFLNPGTLTGSIGVMMGSSDWSELMDKIGIKPEVIKSGKYKDMGAYYRELSEEERKMIQSMIDGTFEQFLSIVSKGRKIPDEKLRPLAQGQVFTGEQAIKYGFADKIGNMNSAIQEASSMAGIVGEPRVIESPDIFERFFSAVYDMPETLSDALRKIW
ncbi:MAG: signal peptide peptidase SppA [Elusimicrobia bacterium CG08_land_8_20_14_0_20_44_26]|nr:MAG: signal peptide peptidase SppA [Elusimicrobia bacterium CG08_land_8_20_14_0_20_44_26]